MRFIFSYCAPGWSYTPHGKDEFEGESFEEAAKHAKDIFDEEDALFGQPEVIMLTTDGEDGMTFSAAIFDFETLERKR